jgi:hypothetical protein
MPCQPHWAARLSSCWWLMIGYVRPMNLARAVRGERLKGIVGARQRTGLLPGGGHLHGWLILVRTRTQAAGLAARMALYSSAIADA